MKITASALCLLCLSTTLFTGCSSADEKAFQSALKAAQSGSAAAQAQLGQYYEQGKGTAKDPGQSLHWHQKAAMQRLFNGCAGRRCKAMLRQTFSFLNSWIKATACWPAGFTCRPGRVTRRRNMQPRGCMTWDWG